MQVKKGRNGNGDSQMPNIIAAGTTITGDINSEGDFRIEGTIKGKVIAHGRIVIGDTGVVEGELFCSDADICGKVTGKLKVENLTILKATASFNGDVTTKKISIEPGAEFTGTCTMGEDKTKPSKK